MRKRGRQRRPAGNPLAGLLAIQSAKARQDVAPMGAEQLIDLGVQYHASLDALREGKGSDIEANALAVAVNIATVAAEAGLGAEFMPIIQAARRAVVTLMARSHDAGRFLFDGPGLQAMREFVEVHDAQLASPDCTGGFMAGVLREVDRRHRAGIVVDVRR